jgi:hypothetical protein
MASSKLLKPVRRWVPSEWVPLDAAAMRIEEYMGSWTLAGSELHRHILAGDLRSAAILRHLPDQPRVVLAPAAWQELHVTCFETGPSKFVDVDGTLDGAKIRLGAWHFFIRRANLDKLYPPHVPAPVAQEGAAPTPSRLAPGRKPTHDWKKAVKKYFVARVRRGKTMPTTNDLLDFCAQKWGWAPDPSDMRKLRKSFIFPAGR